MSRIFNMRLFLFSAFKVIIRGTHARNPVCSVPGLSLRQRRQSSRTNLDVASGRLMKFKQGPAERIGYVSTPSVLHGISKKGLAPHFFPTRQRESRLRAAYKPYRFKIKNYFCRFVRVESSNRDKSTHREEQSRRGKDFIQY